MRDACPQTITRLLRDVQAGEAAAAESLVAIAYAELAGLAHRHLSSRRAGHTLQPTALIHEAWLKLAAHIENVNDRRHFFAVASRAMRQVLADHARRRGRLKRGAGELRVTLAQSAEVADTAPQGIDLVDLNDSLKRLARLNERHARVVELRVFGALTIAETADVLGVSHGTVETDWFTAKAWLRGEFEGKR